MEKTVETTFRALILDVMVCMMESDGRIDEREVDRIGEIFEELAGFKLSKKMRDKLIASVTVTRSEVLDLLRTRAGVLDDSQRRRIFRAGRIILEADTRSHSEEWRFLRDVGSALDVSDE